ncbi:MAG: hypothetical protein II653_07265 [Lachnospiraceae bacterium]|nr:hypothetical protein [Lachnospiraceae bacterium]
MNDNEKIDAIMEKLDIIVEELDIIVDRLNESKREIDDNHYILNCILNKLK